MNSRNTHTHTHTSTHTHKHTHTDIYIYINVYICIYNRTLPTGFYIQWRSSVYIRYIMCWRPELPQSPFGDNCRDIVFNDYVCVIPILLPRDLSTVCVVDIRIRLHMFFTLFINSLLFFFWTNQSLTKFNFKCPILFILTASTIIKIQKATFETVCSEIILLNAVLY